MRFALCFVLSAFASLAQEAPSGFELRATLSFEGAYANDLAQAPRDGIQETGGVRLLLYPEWKIDEHWSFVGAVQVRSRPYFYDEFETQGYGLKTDILQAQLAYSRVSGDRSLTVRAGQMSSAFGGFLLRYDDAVNPLIDIPIAYGYYGAGVTTLGLMGAEVDATIGRLDARAQFTNSSPANRRSVFDSNQYGDWAGGAGYTIVQGLRIGVSGYRGPYLDSKWPHLGPDTSNLRSLPGTGLSLELEAAHGPWNVHGELQKFAFAYATIPTFRECAGYIEVKRTLHPRWYVAARFNERTTRTRQETGEAVVGFRPNRRQLLKFGYEKTVGPSPDDNYNTIAVQLVTSLGPIAATHH